uniref:Uncharacterized protein n=1 Tax=Glossina austeni TaxID=7395 RepID=A0A1A9VA46_GLOAU
MTYDIFSLLYNLLRSVILHAVDSLSAYLFVFYVIHEKVAKAKMLTKVAYEIVPASLWLQLINCLQFSESQSGLKFLQSIRSSVRMKIFKSAAKCGPLQNLNIDWKSETIVGNP